MIQTDITNGMVKSDFNRPNRSVTMIPAFYVLIHQRTGKIIIGACSNLYKRLKSVRADMRGGKHRNTIIRALCIGDYSFSLYYKECTDVNEAYDLKQAVIDKYLSTGILVNDSANARKPRSSLPDARLMAGVAEFEDDDDVDRQLSDYGRVASFAD